MQFAFGVISSFPPEFWLFGEQIVNTVFIRLKVAAFIKFSACPMRRLFEGGVYFEITFLNSLTTVTVKGM